MVYSVGNLKYEILNVPNQPIFDLLRDTVYGTKGVRLIHKDTDKKLKELQFPDFHTLWKEDQLLGVAVYCKRSVKLNKEIVDAYYIRYFSINKDFQNKGLGKYLTQRIEEHYKATVTKKTIFYAYIEEKNIQSIGVTKHFQPKKIGIMSPVFFSRFSPKRSSNSSLASKTDLVNIKKSLNKQYGNYATFNLNRLGYENSYYIYKEGSEIIAGVQLINTNWGINALPGLIGWFSLYVFPFIPILNKIADGKNIFFSGVEGIYYQLGKENELIQLLEHALAQSGNSKALIYLDKKDNLYKALKNRSDLGFLNKIQKSPSVRIIQQSLFLDEKDELFLATSTKYISAYDVT